MNMLYPRILQKSEREPGESFNCIINITRVSCVAAGCKKGAECFWWSHKPLHGFKPASGCQAEEVG
jgi:hypothetical protein